MDRLDAMNVVVAVSEGGSLSAASRLLRMPLPTVSRKLSELESHLNARLFNRSTRRLTPTDSGLAYLEACKRILEDVSETERLVAGEFSRPQGDLVVAAPIVFGRLHVLPVITDFLIAYPDVRVRLVQGDRLINLLEDQVDVAVRIGELADNRLIASRCGVTRWVVCASPAYLSGHPKPTHPSDLSAHSMIAFDGITSAESWTFKNAGSELSVAIRPKLVVNTAEAAIDAAIAGAGLTRVLEYQVESAVRAGSLLTVLETFEHAPSPISLVHSNQRRLPLKVRAFLDFSAPRLRSRLGSPPTRQPSVNP